MTKPMKTVDTPSGSNRKKVHIKLEGHVVPKLTPEDFAAGKTPNSGKLHKDGTPVVGQDADHDAMRAAERAAEKAAGDDSLDGSDGSHASHSHNHPTPAPTPTPSPTVPPTSAGAAF